MSWMQAMYGTPDGTPTIARYGLQNPAPAAPAAPTGGRGQSVPQLMTGQAQLQAARDDAADEARYTAAAATPIVAAARGRAAQFAPIPVSRIATTDPYVGMSSDERAVVQQGVANGARMLQSAGLPVPAGIVGVTASAPAAKGAPSPVPSPAAQAQPALAAAPPISNRMLPQFISALSGLQAVRGSAQTTDARQWLAHLMEVQENDIANGTKQSAAVEAAMAQARLNAQTLIGAGTLANSIYNPGFTVPQQ